MNSFWNFKRICNSVCNEFTYLFKRHSSLGGHMPTVYSISIQFVPTTIQSTLMVSASLSMLPLCRMLGRLLLLCLSIAPQNTALGSLCRPSLTCVHLFIFILLTWLVMYRAKISYCAPSFGIS